jgi:hypothetical protein
MTAYGLVAGMSAVVWFTATRSSKDIFSNVRMGVENSENVCFKINGWKVLKYVCVPLTDYCLCI